MGFTPLAFTFDIGYYPKHFFTRAKTVAKELKVNHKTIDIRQYIRENDRLSYQKTAELYDRKESLKLKDEFIKYYAEGRQHYSVKCKHSLSFVRTCQLCRHTVIRAYYAEAIKHKVNIVILGINEWAGLNQNPHSKKYTFNAIRRLKPYRNKPEVFIVHLPFLLQRNIVDTQKIIESLGWKKPRGEDLVESNANSCLFARAAENKARRLLGFHPDSTRLAREVTVGFITKKQAQDALKKIHSYSPRVREVLEKANII